MSEKYFGWVSRGGYSNVVIIKNLCEAHVFNKRINDFEIDNYYLKAAWDPGSEFDEITKEQADEIIARIKK